MGTMGVYRIRNLNTGKCYVGASTDVEKRLRQHYSWLRDGCHWNYKLQGAARISGINRLAFEQVETVKRRSDLSDRELAWIKSLDAVAGGYNLTYKTSCESWVGFKRRPSRGPADGDTRVLYGLVVAAIVAAGFYATFVPDQAAGTAQEIITGPATAKPFNFR